LHKEDVLSAFNAPSSFLRTQKVDVSSPLSAVVGKPDITDRNAHV